MCPSSTVNLLSAEPERPTRLEFKEGEEVIEERFEAIAAALGFEVLV